MSKDVEMDGLALVQLEIAAEKAASDYLNKYDDYEVEHIGAEEIFKVGFIAGGKLRLLQQGD